jgi:FMN phosphatase YigB (HAD superfamily)
VQIVKRLIDFGYCRSQHGFSSDEAVLAWFEQSHPADFRTHSPGFSPIDYLLDNDDLRKASAHPVGHYLVHGADERRPAKPAPSIRAYRGEPTGVEVDPGRARIAFVIHIYYADYVDYFLSRLAAIELADSRVFISVSEDVMAQFGDHIRQSLGDRLADVRVVPNRGRNLLPLLVTFADLLVDYDAICHCHSKQSRYSGRRQTEWADYLIAATLPPPDVMTRHVAMILSGRCDAIAPAPYRGLPAWASHGLSNGHHLSMLQTRLGLEPETGFMSYPVGGMFWITPKILRTILSLGLTAEDFPVEPSAPDGEIHHALERLLGTVAGERLAFYDQVTSTYWDPDAVLEAELRRFGRLSELKEAINQHDLITFDFFDTIAHRAVGDEDWAKKRVEFILGADYHRRRNEAERTLRDRLGPNEDVSLTSIGTELLANGFTRAYEAISLERAFDFKTLRPSREIVEAYRHAIDEGKSVFILSDSYYDAGFVTQFLDAQDLPEPECILVSGDAGCRKDRGDMWARMSATRGNRKALHIGDNIHSDIQLAAAEGFDTFYVPHWRNALLRIGGLSKAARRANHLNVAFGFTAEHAAVIDEPEEEEE